ncbi:hypothetical protein RB195_009108 [Necator americanus]|uniref:Uncharacterized protein n=1 Tax=Necator americanus TaxID=51031 RepID=A0ABR1CRS9_NECAM
MLKLELGPSLAAIIYAVRVEASDGPITTVAGFFVSLQACLPTERHQTSIFNSSTFDSRPFIPWSPLVQLKPTIIVEKQCQLIARLMAKISQCFLYIDRLRKLQRTKNISVLSE